MVVVRLSALHTGCLYPRRKYSWYSFLLEAESAPEPQCGRKDYGNEKLQLHHRGTEPATFRLVAQCLNQLRYGVTPSSMYAPSNAISVSSPLWTSRLTLSFYKSSGQGIFANFRKQRLTKVCSSVAVVLTTFHASGPYNSTKRNITAKHAEFRPSRYSTVSPHCVELKKKHYLLFEFVNLQVMGARFNTLNTERRLLYLNTQFVPPSKHFSSRL